MRVIKENSVKFSSFHKSLPSVRKRYNGNKPSYYNAGIVSEADSSLENFAEGQNSFVLKINDYITSINSIDSVQNLNQLVCSTIKKYFDFVEAGFFLFDANNNWLIPPDNTSSSASNEFINNAYKEGILEWAFSSRLPRTIPLYKVYTMREEDSKYLIIPLFEGSEPKGIFSILHNNKSSNEEFVINYLQLLVNFAFQRITILINREETKAAYNSLQDYQSKLSNDYKLSALGELAGGILEEILDPLQVIYTSADLVSKAEGNEQIIFSIKNQVRKIETSAARLRKFADRSDYSKLKIIPCDVNKLIENYLAIINSSLEKKNIECILDLEHGLPSILTHSDLINQLLVNVFSIITSDFTKTGGILIQTRMVKDKVKLSFISTEEIAAMSENAASAYKIVSQLVNRHEGQIEIISGSTNSGYNAGSKVEITFPLKRKIRS